jgi:two-component system, OmpR family, sensor kinase
VFVLGVLTAFLAAGRVLAPMRDLTDTARSITEIEPHAAHRRPRQRRDRRARAQVQRDARPARGLRSRASARWSATPATRCARPITIVRSHLERLGDDPDERPVAIVLVTDELDRTRRFVERAPVP